MNKFKEGQSVKIIDTFFNSGLFVNGNKDRIWKIKRINASEESNIIYYDIKSGEFVTSVCEDSLTDDILTNFNNKKLRTSQEILASIKRWNSGSDSWNKELLIFLIDYIEMKYE